MFQTEEAVGGRRDLELEMSKLSHRTLKKQVYSVTEYKATGDTKVNKTIIKQNPEK